MSTTNDSVIVAEIATAPSTSDPAATNEQGTGDDSAPPSYPADDASIPRKDLVADDSVGSSASEAYDAAEDTATITDAASLPPWDFANRRVLVQNVHRYDDAKKLGKMVSRWTSDLALVEGRGIQIKVEKIKKPPKDNWMVLTLACPSMVEPLIQYVNEKRPATKNGSVMFAKRPASVQSSSTGDVPDAGNATKTPALDVRGSNAASGNDGRPSSIKRSSSCGNDSCDDAGDHESANHLANKRQKLIEESRRPVSDDEVKDAVIPLWRQSPDDQLRSKVRDLIRNCALKIVKECKARCHQLAREKSRGSKQPSAVPNWLQASGTPIRIQEIVPVPSPIRNKAEFTFGYRYLFDDAGDANRNAEDGHTDEVINSDTAANIDAKVPGDACSSRLNISDADAKRSGERPRYKRVPSVGVCARGWAGGVSLPHSCPNIPREACAIVDVVEKFLQDSPLPVYDTAHHRGIWRTLTVRSSRRTREVMVVVVHSPITGGIAEQQDCESSSISYTESFESEKNRLLSRLVSAELPTSSDSANGAKVEPALKVTSVFFQEFHGLSHPPPEHPVQHAFGKTYITERLGECLFQISPGSFFQVNTEGAEILYQLVIDRVREVALVPSQTLLFDVCCGTGTIGVSCLKAGVVSRVVGVDISIPAIRDAERNATLNGFLGGEDDSEGAGNSDRGSARFVASRAEEMLGKEIFKAREGFPGMEFVAVVDPAREGLHADVCKTLRSNGKIRRIVYVSCNPTGTLVRDAALLCAPPTKRYSGRPFKVTSATPIDMFPLTSVR
jgi:tRNA (uracil-5-)-methyltransferase